MGSVAQQVLASGHSSYLSWQRDCSQCSRPQLLRHMQTSTKMTSTVGWRICGLRAPCLQPVFVTGAEGPGIRKQCRIEIVGVAGGLRCFFPAFVYRLQQWHSTPHTSCFPRVCGQKRSMHACAWPAQSCGRGLQRLSMLANVSCWSLCGACSGGIICRTRSWSAVHKTRAGLQAARMLQRRLRINVKTWKCSHVEKARACR